MWLVIKLLSEHQGTLKTNAAAPLSVTNSKVSQKHQQKQMSKLWSALAYREEALNHQIVSYIFTPFFSWINTFKLPIASSNNLGH